MKKKIFLLVLIVFLLVTGCGKKETINEDALRFKNEYESLNGQTTSYGTTYREVNIDSDNPFIYISPSDLVKKIENGETLYIYFGDKMCPWCRSVIETTIKSAKEKKINKIYYVEIWDNDHNEILRDKYSLNENGEVVLEKKGTDEYYKLLDYFKAYLSDYELTNSNGEKVSVGEKRIFAPNFVYIRNGKVEKITAGTSSKQESHDSELTDEIISDELNNMNSFFTQNGVCNSAC